MHISNVGPSPVDLHPSDKKRLVSRKKFFSISFTKQWHLMASSSWEERSSEPSEIDALDANIDVSPVAAISQLRQKDVHRPKVIWRQRPWGHVITKKFLKSNVRWSCENFPWTCPLVLGSSNDIQAIPRPCVAQLINSNENTRRWIHSRRVGVHVGRECRRPVPHQSRIVAVRPHLQSLSQRDHFQETRRLFHPSSQFQFAP
jgi:hypothetical protein